MNKKILIGIIAFLVIVIFIVCAIFIINKNSTHEANNYESVDNKLTGDSKILVVYYSAQNHTKNVANKIAENLGADIYELVPVDVYTEDDLDWTNSNSRVSLEHNDTSLRDIELVSTEIDGFENYDTILIGYPIWWGIAAWPVNSFVKSNDFTGKTVIPFCTAYSSGIGQSGKLLEELAGTGNWLDGIRFSENPSDSDIKSWTDSLK
jgi:flavodoxin